MIFSMSSSLDGYIAGPDGDFSWTVPDAELHRFHNERVRGLSAHLLGRRLYETMVYWEGEDEGRDEVEREFAEIWRALPKVVFSSTLTTVEGNTRLATGSPAEELAKLDGDVGVGGAGHEGDELLPGAAGTRASRRRATCARSERRRSM